MDAILGDKEAEQREQEAIKERLRLSKPDVWNVYLEGNAELRHEVDFEVYLIAVANTAGIKEDIGEWNLFRFYNLQTFLKEQSENGR